MRALYFSALHLSNRGLTTSLIIPSQVSLSRTQHGFGHDSSEGEPRCCEALLTKHTSARHFNTTEGLVLNTQEPKISWVLFSWANTNSYCWQGRKATEAHLPRGCRSQACRHKTFSKAGREGRKAPRMLLARREALCPPRQGAQGRRTALPGLPLPSCGCLTEHQGHAALGGPITLLFKHRIRKIIYRSPTLETALNPNCTRFNTGQKLKSTEQPSRAAPQGYGRRRPALPTTPSYLLLASGPGKRHCYLSVFSTSQRWQVLPSG